MALPALDSPNWQGTAKAYLLGVRCIFSTILTLVLFATYVGIGALASYARAMVRLRPVIGDRDPNLLGSIQRSRGTRTFYQVRIGEDTRAAADALCSQIHRAGQACLVLRNRG